MGNRYAAAIAIIAAMCSVGVLAGESAAKTRLTMYWHEGGTTVQQLNKLTNAFEKENPDVEVKVVNGPGDWNEYYNKFLLMAASGTPFDIAQITVAYPYFARKGVFADLSPYFKSTKISIPASVQNVYTLDGRKWGVPWGVFTNPMVYVKGLFEGAGLRDLPTDWDEKTFTQDAYLAMAKKLTRDTNGDGRLDNFASYSLYGADFWAFGGDFLDASGRVATANSKAMIEGMTWVNDLVRKWQVMPTPEDSSRLGLPWNAIVTGKIGMNPFGNWGFESMKASKLRWDVGVTPKGVYRTNELSIDALAIGSGCKHKREAWRFIEYLVGSKTELAAMAMSMAAIPAAKQALPHFIELTRTKYPNVNWACVIDAMSYGKTKSFYKAPINSLILDRISEEEIGRMKSGKQSVVQALDRIQDRFTKELAQAKVK